MSDYIIKTWGKGTKFERTEYRDLGGRLHRSQGPAIFFRNGAEEYWVKGRLHRIDGPAIVHPNGDKEYWVNGKCLLKKEFFTLYLKPSRVESFIKH